MQTSSLNRYRHIFRIFVQTQTHKIHTGGPSLFPVNVEIQCGSNYFSSQSWLKTWFYWTSSLQVNSVWNRYCRYPLVPCTAVHRLHTTKGFDHKANISQTLETEEDLSKLVEDVIDKAKQKDVMVGSIPRGQIEQLALGLHHCGYLPSQITSLLSTHPTFLLQHRGLLPIVHQLLSHGLDLSQVETVLYTFPAIVTVSKTRVDETIDILRNSGFQEHSIRKILSGNPAVVRVTTSMLAQRLAALRQLFKSADVVALTVNSPQVLTADWEELKAKFDYVFHEMNVTQRQMVYASIFSYPLSHIHHRHAFLVRAGLFSMAKRREGERSPNARLDQIITSSDQVFCRKFGGFEVAEYRAFCELFDKEKTMTQDSDSESDQDE